MDKKVLKNYLYNFGYQILILIIPLITTPYVSRVLGADGIGIYGYTYAIAQYFVLFGCIGLNLYGQREIAFHQKNSEKRSQLFAELMVIRIIAVSVSLVIYLVTCCQDDRYRWIYVFYILDILAAMIDVTWFFQGMEDFKKVTLRNSVVKLTGVLLIFVLVKDSSDLPQYVVCYSGTLLLGNLSMWLYIPRFVNRTSWHHLTFKRHIKPTVIMFLPQLATSMYTMLDKPMIGFLTGDDKQVAYYEQAQKILKVALAVPTSLGTVMMPRVANLFAKDRMDDIKDQMYQSFRFISMITIPICLGIIGVAEGFVPWFFGEGYELVVPNMMLGAPIIICIGLSNIIGVQYLLPTKRQKAYTISVLCGTVVNLVLNLSLIPYIKSIGATIATVIAETAVTAVQFYCIRKEFSFRYLGSLVWRYILSAVMMFCVVYFIADKIKIGILETFFEIIIGMVTYFCVLLLLRDNAVLAICKKVIKK